MTAATVRVCRLMDQQVELENNGTLLHHTAERLCWFGSSPLNVYYVNAGCSCIPDRDGEVHTGVGYNFLRRLQRGACKPWGPAVMPFPDSRVFHQHDVKIVYSVKESRAY